MNANEMTLKALKAAAPEYSTRRWSAVDVALTGKNADLEPGGAQGYDIIRVDGDTVHCTARCYCQVVGNDVCLNLPSDLDDAQYAGALEVYLEEAESIVIGSGLPGEWDGDGWALDFCATFETQVVRDASGGLDLEATFQALADAHGAAVAEWDEECVLMSAMLDCAAGWKDEKGNDLPAVA